MEQSYTSGGQTSGMERRQACRFRPLHLLLVFVCLSHVISTVPQVEARPSPVDLLLEDFTALLQRAQRLEQAGVPVFQRLQQHLTAFLSGVEDAQHSLWESVARDNARGLEAAVRRGAVVERKNADQMTPLALASKEGRTDAVRALLRLGAAVNSTSGAMDWTPLLWARAYRRTDCETLLLAAGANQGKVGDVQKLLFEAVGRDDAEGIEAAVHLGADLEAKDGEQMTALGLAAKEGRERAVSTLLRLGAEVEAAAGERGWSPLLWAVANRQNQTEALLRKAGAQQQKVTKEEAQDLLWKGVDVDDRLKIERAFLSGADLEKRRDRWTPLTVASCRGRLEAVRALVTLGARLEGRDGRSEGTALYCASRAGHEAVARLLVEAGASLEAESKGGYTPLHEASFRGHLSTAKLLVEAGASLEAEGKDRWTPLHAASYSGHLSVVKLLVEAGASLEVEDKDTRTPLHYASFRGHLSTVKLLVEAGADINPRDSIRWTPLRLAEFNGHSAVAAYLRSVGATT